jgi:hypothetical protein
VCERPWPAQTHEADPQSFPGYTERKREKEREREIYTLTHTHTHTQRKREREREREREKERDRDKRAHSSVMGRRGKRPRGNDASLGLSER